MSTSTHSTNPSQKTMDFRQKYKTERCRYWYERGFCPFNQFCAFAHAEEQLRGKAQFNEHYKTKICVNFKKTGCCKYGDRCQFLHPKEASTPYSKADARDYSHLDTFSERPSSSSYDSDLTRHQKHLNILSDYGLDLLTLYLGSDHSDGGRFWWTGWISMSWNRSNGMSLRISSRIMTSRGSRDLGPCDRRYLITIKLNISLTLQQASCHSLDYDTPNPLDTTTVATLTATSIAGWRLTSCWSSFLWFLICLCDLLILIYYSYLMNLVQQKVKQRNITPNFLRFRRKSTANSIGKKHEEDKVETQITTERTERSSSKASRCSFEAYEHRVLHLSILKNQLAHKENGEEAELPLRKNIIQGENLLKKRECSPGERPINTERDNERSNRIMQKMQDSKKRNSASGKIINKVSNRTPSNPKRTEQSLEKEDQKAKQMNVDLMSNLMKNQFAPNYIKKLKMMKIQNANEKKKPAKQKLLNLIVPIKSEEEKNNYEIYGELGKGAYGIVKMGMDKRTNEKIAVKIYEKKRLDEPNKVKNLEREINILAELSHPTIAKLLDVIETQTELYLILQYGGANSLYNYLLSKPEHRLPEPEAKQFILVIAEALKYLHDLDITHRDIKAENILINRNRQLKLIDFGFSLRCRKNQTIDTFCGTPTYMAPEIVSKVDHSPVYTDMWSLGILFYVLLQGNYPFRAKNESQLFEKIRRGHFEYIVNDISKESKRMIESLLRVSHLERLTINQLLSQEHRKWLSSQ